MIRILLLEPDRVLAQQYTSFLVGEGYAVSWREDAQSGVIMADKYQPDLVIIELLLAGHSGIEFLYEFRSYADWRTVPALILSNVAKRDIGVPDSTLSELGVGAYLYKPETTLGLLGKQVKKLLTAVNTPIS
jgi:DNA-binding response OmpR family regulator